MRLTRSLISSPGGSPHYKANPYQRAANTGLALYSGRNIPALILMSHPMSVLRTLHLSEAQEL